MIIQQTWRARRFLRLVRAAVTIQRRYRAMRLLKIASRHKKLTSTVKRRVWHFTKSTRVGRWLVAHQGLEYLLVLLWLLAASVFYWIENGWSFAQARRGSLLVVRLPRTTGFLLLGPEWAQHRFWRGATWHTSYRNQTVPCCRVWRSEVSSRNSTRCCIFMSRLDLTASRLHAGGACADRCSTDRHLPGTVPAPCQPPHAVPTVIPRGHGNHDCGTGMW